MLNELTKYRAPVKQCLDRFMAERCGEMAEVNDWGKDVCERMQYFATRGKMIRGCLVMFANSLFNDEVNENAALAGAAMELFQASFLIHDDIMDGDTLRRGEPTLFQQYAEQGREKKITNPRRFGESMGICAGDMTFFFGSQILTEMDCNRSLQTRIINRCFREIASTCVAQMEDVALGMGVEEPDEAAILKLYRHKTGRYTFSLPMILGAMLDEQPDEVLAILEVIGDQMGVIFQMKDDELGLFGSEEMIGKTVGSDLRENKQTVLRVLLEQAANAEEREKLDSIMGREDITRKEVDWVRNLTIQSGVRNELERRARRLADHVRERIDQLNGVPDNKKRQLLKLLEYNLNRNI
ncbi:MAG: polyprenyl synthetase family protein [Lentisphaeria bacterium]